MLKLSINFFYLLFCNKRFDKCDTKNNTTPHNIILKIQVLTRNEQLIIKLINTQERNKKPLEDDGMIAKLRILAY